MVSTLKKSLAPLAEWAALMTAFLEYHVPKDRANALRKEMISRKQGKEDVVQYIADKRLPCLEMNPTAPTPFSQMRSFIIEGMIPEIKATILHKDNPNFDALI